MKKVKIYLTSIIAIIMLTMSTQVFADENYVDPTNAITMPSSLSNGTGTVSTSISGDMSYQFIEISADKYATIKKYEAIYDVIYAYIHNDSNYKTLAENYMNTYNQTMQGIQSTYGIEFTKEGLNTIRALWVSELGTYNTASWKSADGKTVQLDLSTFEGTKYFVVWVKIGETYDAEAYKVVGTKTNNNNDDDESTENNIVDNNITNNGTTNNGTTSNGTTSNGTKNSATKKTDTTVASAKKLPQTGVSSVILILISGFAIFAIISYRKYRNIK